MKKHPKSKPAKCQKQVCHPVVVTYEERPGATEQEEPRNCKEPNGTLSGATGAAEDLLDEPWCESPEAKLAPW